MKHSLVKKTIVETAAHLFYQNGYNLTGINEIIKEAGIAKATLYSHFKSKDDICIAYLEYRDESFLEAIEGFVIKKEKGKKQILAIFDFLKSFYNDESFNGCWCLNTYSELPRENEKVRKKIQSQKKVFLDLIEKIVSTNLSENTKKQNQVIAKQVYLLYEGAISESNLHQNSWPINTAKELCAQILS